MWVPQAPGLVVNLRDDVTPSEIIFVNTCKDTVPQIKVCSSQNGGCSCRTGGWSWSSSWTRSSGRPRTQKWTREILKFRKIQTKSVKWAWGLIQKVKEMSQHAEQHPSTQQYQVPEQQRSLWYSVAAFICAFGSCWNKIWRIGSFSCNSSAINLIWKAWDNNLI